MKKIKVNGIEKFREKRNADIKADVDADGNLVVERVGGHKIVSGMVLLWGEVQRINKLALKNFKPKLDARGQIDRSNMDLSELANFKPETDKNTQFLYSLIKSIDDKEKVDIKDIINFDDRELMDTVLEIILEENGLLEVSESEAKNDQESPKPQPQS